MAGLLDSEVFQNVLNSLQTGVYLVDRDRKILFWNDGAERITGYMRHEVLGRLCEEALLAYCDRSGVMLHGATSPLLGALHEGRIREAHVYLRHKAGHRVPVRVRVAPIRGGDGSVVGAAESFDEVRSVPALDHHQSNLAAYGCLDVSTGLPNHGFTQSHLRESLSCYLEHHLPFGILCIAVQQVKELKETRGREAVEAILHVVAQTIKHALPDGFLGRWAEEQFLVIVSDCSRVDLERAAHDIQKIVGRSAIQWWGDSLSVDVSLHWTMVESGDTMDTLLLRAQSPPRSPQILTLPANPGETDDHQEN
jgi:PAS domain S-box-containing protein/diguanylate cyclase (GGDEF)-like protein